MILFQSFPFYEQSWMHKRSTYALRNGKILLSKARITFCQLGCECCSKNLSLIMDNALIWIYLKTNRIKFSKGTISFLISNKLHKFQFCVIFQTMSKWQDCNFRYFNFLLWTREGFLGPFLRLGPLRRQYNLISWALEVWILSPIDIKTNF